MTQQTHIPILVKKYSLYDGELQLLERGGLEFTSPFTTESFMTRTRDKFFNYLFFEGCNDDHIRMNRVDKIDQ